MENSIQLLDVFFGESESTIRKDLKLNLKKLLHESSLSEEESYSALLALATAAQHTPLTEIASARLQQLGLSEDHVQEVRESAAIMGMLNVYYRFKHMLESGREELEEEYRRAGLRMMSLARPAVGKARFEMLAFAVSVFNGCQDCINSHENVLRQEGLGLDKIHDLARLAAVVKGVSVL